MSLERFIYYRIADATPSLRAALLAMHADLCRRHPPLQARLLCRAGDDGGGAETWLEIYARAGGVDQSLLDEIEACAASVIGSRLVGARRLESFEACAS